MTSKMRWVRSLRLLGVGCVAILPFLIPDVAGTQRHDPRVGDLPEAEFHLARVISNEPARWFSRLYPAYVGRRLPSSGRAFP
jgi:hypothetical protein